MRSGGRTKFKTRLRRITKPKATSKNKSKKEKIRKKRIMKMKANIMTKKRIKEWTE